LPPNTRAAANAIVYAVVAPPTPIASVSSVAIRSGSATARTVVSSKTMK